MNCRLLNLLAEKRRSRNSRHLSPERLHGVAAVSAYRFGQFRVWDPRDLAGHLSPSRLARRSAGVRLGSRFRTAGQANKIPGELVAQKRRKMRTRSRPNEPETPKKILKSKGLVTRFGAQQVRVETRSVREEVRGFNFLNGR